jgi:nickel transport protein
MAEPVATMGTVPHDFAVMKSLLVALVACLALVGLPSSAWAHQVETFYTLGNQLEFQSILGEGEPFAGATVTIYAPNQPNLPWRTLTTDAEGRFAFVPDESIPGDWEVAIESEDVSHADYWTVPVGEQGIIYDAISLDDSLDRHNIIAAATLTPWLMAVASGLGWAWWKKPR